MEECRAHLVMYAKFYFQIDKLIRPLYRSLSTYAKGASRARINGLSDAKVCFSNNACGNYRQHLH